MSKQSDLVNITQGDADINGGTIDGTVIGGSTPAAISGTTGTFSGNLTVDTNTLFVDSANNRVGIGTSSPLSPLVVAEGTGQHGFEVQPGTLTYAFAYDRATADYGDLDIGGQTLRFSTDNGSERMRITSSGNVGIGTINPATTLDVSDVSRYTFNVSNAYTLQTSINAAGSAFADDYKNAAQHIWQSSGAESMRIDSAGRVTMPYQPSFRAHTFVPISASAGVIVWQTTAHNTGNHYNTSNGTFTAPVNGTYHFAGNILMIANSSTDYIRVLFRINGVPSTLFSDSLTGGAPGAFTNYNYYSIQIAQSFYLSAGDTVQMWSNNPGGSTYSEGAYGSFSGFLVG